MDSAFPGSHPKSEWYFSPFRVILLRRYAAWRPGPGTCRRTPTGFHPLAQGCGHAATLGIQSQTDLPQRGCVRFSRRDGVVGPNPFGVGALWGPPTQGSSCLATLG